MSILIDVVIPVNFVVKGQHRSIMQCHFLVLFLLEKTAYAACLCTLRLTYLLHFKP
jgi:hypothetical protein